MAMPGGAVVVGAGLLAIADSEDALACVLGHEIMHCDLGHTTKRMFDVQDRDRLSDARRATINPFEFGATHTPEQELAADREGFRLAARAGYSPYGALRLLQYLDAVFPNPNPRPGQLTIARRIAQLDGEIAANHWQNLADTRHPLALPDWG
jgi:predicted Zn-dependent protease